MKNPTATNPDEYQGWKNFETWTVALMLDNEPKQHTHCMKMAQESVDKFELADSFKDYVYDLCPIFESKDLGTMTAALAKAAYDRANWLEIAEHYLTKVSEG